MRLGKWGTFPQACCQLINDEAIRLVRLFLLIFCLCVLLQAAALSPKGTRYANAIAPKEQRNFRLGVILGDIA